LLESAYQGCFAYELRKRGVRVDSEIALPILYDGIQLDVGYRIDMVIDQSIIIENKTVEQLLPIHEAQLLTYMKLGGFQLGFLINWNVRLIKNGIKRLVLNLPEPSWRQPHKENI
jgi:GxxExxY protein